MPDYIYLLENRLSANQQNALRVVRDSARQAQMTVFLTGDAVRDLTCGNPVRDLEVVVHGNAVDLKTAITAAGGKLWGEDLPSRTLYLCFPGNVRLDLRSGRRADYPKPGKPVFQWVGIQDDLRSRDFTVNAMAISLNEGSYGLLMDPSNGVADIESRLLRLVSNYGFLENPVLMIRATRLKARLAFELDERTQTRYENAKGEEMIAHISEHERSYELEQIGHEEEPLKVMHALEAEGWMQHLFAGWTAAKADVEKLTALHDLSIELQVQGVHADMSAAQMQLLTAKLAQKDIAELKKKLLRPGFVEEWNHLDAQAADFAKVLLAKDNSSPSATYKLFTTHPSESVLWLGFTTKQASIKEKYQNFLKEWPQARQKIPYALMLEMRITPELPGYQDLVHSIFLQLIDGGLTTTEEFRALLEPHSPPAPPPPVTIKRTRAKKGAEAKKARIADDEDEDSDDLGSDDDEEDDEEIEGLDLGGDDLDLGLDDSRAALPNAEGDDDDIFARDSGGRGSRDLDEDADDDSDDEDDRDDDSSSPSGKGRKGSGGKASKRSESKRDGSTARGAGLKALAYKLDLTEPSDPADLDESDPIIETDDDPEPPSPPTKAGKSKPTPKKATPSPVAAKKAAPGKAKPVAVVKSTAAAKAPAKAAKAVPAPAKKAPVAPKSLSLAKAKPAAKKAVPAKAVVKGKPAPVAKPVPSKSAPSKPVASRLAKAIKSAKKR